MTDNAESLPYDPAFDPETIEYKRKAMLRDLYRYDPRRLRITRAEVEELGLEYDGPLYGEDINPVPEDQSHE